MNVFAFVNQKGGVGKSTLSLHVGAAIARRGRRVIVADMDPQATATAGTVGAGNYTAMADLLDMSASPSLGALAVDVPAWGFRLVPTSYVSLTTRALELEGSMQTAQFALLDALAKHEDEADVMLIDCPPNFGPLTSVALGAATGVIAPLQPAGEPTHGLHQLEQRITGAKRVNSQLALLGVVLVGYQGYSVDKEVRQFIESEPAYGWVRSIRLTNGFKRAFIMQRPLADIASSKSERDAVAEVDEIAQALLGAPVGAA